jgi:AcrR family transcriptional regulator
MRSKDEIKEIKILEAALSIIAKTGLAGLKMSDLAKEAKLAIGTIYIYFKDKDELVRKLYLYLMKGITKESTAVFLSDESVKIKVKKIAFNYLSNSILSPERSVFFEQYFRSPYFQETEAVLFEENLVMKPIYDVVAEGQRQDIIKKIDQEMLVTLVCGMLDSVAKTAIYEGKDIDQIDFEVIFSVIWDGIKS